MLNENFELGQIGLWTGVFDAMPSSLAKEYVAYIEELGFSTLWLPETVGRDPFVSATMFLGHTTKLNLATGIANVYARDAVTMANTQRALEEAFPGRFLLGLGVSHEHLVNRVRKHDYSKPYSYMVDYLDDMDNTIFKAVGPSERSGTVLAALGPRMLKLAASRADGAHPYFVPVAHTAYAREILGGEAILAPEQMVILDTNAESARATARLHMSPYMRAPNYQNNLLRHGFVEDDLADGGSDKLVDAIVAWGDVSVAVERVAAHLDAGANHVAVQLLSADGASLPREQLSELASGLLAL
ncbi:MAG: LLM class F420-dependent oxidoreductase [Acidimicrobiia bacterium]